MGREVSEISEELKKAVGGRECEILRKRRKKKKNPKGFKRGEKACRDRRKREDERRFLVI